MEREVEVPVWVQHFYNLWAFVQYWLSITMKGVMNVYFNP